MYVCRLKKDRIMENVILANGAFPQNEAHLQILKRAKNLICCDGAIAKLVEHGITPTVIVGDCDSMSSSDLARWGHLVQPDRSEEYNDLQKALKYAQRHHLDDLLLLGCGGLRDDHFIANISIMATYSAVLHLTLLTDRGTFRAIRTSTTLPCRPGQQVSIFTKDETLPLTFHGLKYPVERRCFKHLWEGSLNEALGDTFTIELHGAGIVVIYVNEE